MLYRLRLILSPSLSFPTQYSHSVKVGERQHMERVLRREEEQLHHAESQLKLAQQAFDQFLQEKDRKAVEAQRRQVVWE